jgi:hypothetical protein
MDRQHMTDFARYAGHHGMDDQPPAPIPRRPHGRSSKAYSATRYFFGVRVNLPKVALAGPWNFSTLLPAFSSTSTASVLPQRPMV